MRRCTECGKPIGHGDMVAGDINKCENHLSKYTNGAKLNAQQTRLKQQRKDTRELHVRKKGW